jgi:hypothetical protein
MFSGVFSWMLERTWPGLFAIPGEGAQNNCSLAVAISYSFVTLGDGGIVPRSEVARGG